MASIKLFLLKNVKSLYELLGLLYKIHSFQVLVGSQVTNSGTESIPACIHCTIRYLLDTKEVLEYNVTTVRNLIKRTIIDIRLDQ